MFSKYFFQKIDNHTDITYSVSAPGAGGLVESRDFVNLRSWQVFKNGNVIEDVDTINDDEKLTKDTTLETDQTVHQVKRSTSEINLTGIQVQGSSMDQSVYSLSKSLGAKAFNDDEYQYPVPEMFGSKSTTDDTDEYVDASETQGTGSPNNSSHRSEEAEHIKDIANDSCDRIYIVSGVSIKYDGMPNVPEYTRLVISV